MPKVSPFHSKRPGTEVHHDNSKCTEGNNIESYNKKPGTGGHPLCKRCKELNAEGKQFIPASYNGLKSVLPKKKR